MGLGFSSIFRSSDFWSVAGSNFRYSSMDLFSKIQFIICHEILTLLLGVHYYSVSSTLSEFSTDLFMYICSLSKVYLHPRLPPLVRLFIFSYVLFPPYFPFHPIPPGRTSDSFYLFVLFRFHSKFPPLLFLIHSLELPRPDDSKLGFKFFYVRVFRASELSPARCTFVHFSCTFCNSCIFAVSTIYQVFTISLDKNILESCR